MSTTFGVKVKIADMDDFSDYTDYDDEYCLVKVAFRSNGIRFINGLSQLLPDEREVIAMDNDQQGIYTIVDIKREIQQQKMNDKFGHLIGKIVKNLDCVPDNTIRDYGILEYISKGNYPFILRFYGGLSYGVSSISDKQPLQDSVLEIQLRTLTID